MIDPPRDAEMSSIWQRLRFMYLGRKSVARFALPLLLLTVIVVILRWATAPMGTVYHGDDEHVFRFRHIDEEEISSHLARLPDTRPDQCKQKQYPVPSEDKVTIILDFHEHQFYDLRVTLESILKFTPTDRYAEIVILDDGSGDQTIQRAAAAYLGSGKFKNVKAYRSERRDGPSLSRFKASKIATGSVLVFLGSDVVVGEGWLEPLVEQVRRNRKVLVASHTDNILSGFRHFKTAETLVNVPSLTLSTLFYHTEDAGLEIDTPVMTGVAFAIDKAFLDGIGSFDEGLNKGGGENLELSLRTWLCGGKVQINRCSRVAVRDALVPLKIQSDQNFQRIAELWLGDWKRTAYNQRSHLFDPSETERLSLQNRRTYLKKHSTCSSPSNFNDYLHKVAPMVRRPPKDSRYFGKLRCRTGYCVQPDFNQASGRVNMVKCRPHMYEPQLFIQYDNMGRLASSGRCVELLPNGAVELTVCDDRKADQLWEFTKEGHLESASRKKQCLEHKVDSTTDINILSASNCLYGERTMKWSFIKY